jgi:hypothetical protein
VEAFRLLPIGEVSGLRYRLGLVFRHHHRLGSIGDRIIGSATGQDVGLLIGPVFIGKVYAIVSILKFKRS